MECFLVAVVQAASVVESTVAASDEHRAAVAAKELLAVESELEWVIVHEFVRLAHFSVLE